MTREQIHIGDMSHETAIDILKLMLEAMETYDCILPTPARINSIKMSIEALEKESKTGHWIETWLSFWCSECKTQFGGAYKFCPNCGAKMESEEQA